MPELHAVRPHRLREQAAAERRKLDALDRLLSRLESRMAAGEDRERRAFERVNADLQLLYRQPGRPTSLVGRVLDLSRSGVRFTAMQELRIGDVLDAHFQRGGRPVSGFGSMHLEVVRCLRSGRVWEVGARFAPAAAAGPAASPADRRRSRRYPVRLEVVFRLPGEGGAVWRGEVRDISTDGLRFFAPRPFPAGAMASVSIHGQDRDGGRAGDRLTLRGNILILRCRRVGRRYEAGARFVSPR
ncbi:MAG TPA: PilZ domain-containing protein [Planctomycetota bacterium]|nr:PilZ domain-containing protein [Planctomycetota bacterium]